MDGIFFFERSGVVIGFFFWCRDRSFLAISPFLSVSSLVSVWF